MPRTAATEESEAESLELTGIVYPPAKETPDNAGELCEEFTTKDLERLLPQLLGLPIAVEHDDSELVGEVCEAKVKHSNQLWVRARVNASTPAGRRAIRDIRAKKLNGLSLSHEYSLFAGRGSRLHIAMDGTGDWRGLPWEAGDGTVVTKRLRELSVCREPARAGCYIQELSDAGCRAVCGTVSAARSALDRRCSADINARGERADRAPQQQNLCLALWTVHCASEQMQGNPETTATENPPTAPGSGPKTTPAATDVPTTGEAAPDAPTTTKPPAVDKVPDDSSAPGSSPGKDGEATDPPSSAEQQRQFQAAMKEASELLLRQREEAERQRSDFEKRSKERDGELAALREKLEKAEEAERAAAARAEEHRAREEEQARRNAVQQFADLQEVMRAIGASPSGEVVVPPASVARDDPLAVQRFGGQVAAEAIKTINHLKDSTGQARMEAHSAKRSRDEALGALAPFGGNNGGTRVGAVNASAEEHKRPRKSESAEDRLRAWYSENTGATWHELKHQHESMAGTQRSGVVNASRHTWALSAEDDASGSSRLCAKQLQPDLYRAICNMNTGRMPGPQAVHELVTEARRAALRQPIPY